MTNDLSTLFFKKIIFFFWAGFGLTDRPKGYQKGVKVNAFVLVKHIHLNAS